MCLGLLNVHDKLTFHHHGGSLSLIIFLSGSPCCLVLMEPLNFLDISVSVVSFLPSFYTSQTGRNCLIVSF